MTNTIAKNSKKSKTKGLSWYVKQADKEFSRYVRLRDSEFKDGQFVGDCCSCGRRLLVVDAEGRWGLGAHAGHYVSRGHKATRWEETNVNLQCAHCNLWRDKLSMLQAYKSYLLDKYGKDAVRELEKLRNQTHRPTKDELQEIINSSKEYVKYTLAHPNGLV